MSTEQDPTIKAMPGMLAGFTLNTDEHSRVPDDAFGPHNTALLAGLPDVSGSFAMLWDDSAFAPGVTIRPTGPPLKKRTRRGIVRTFPAEMTTRYAPGVQNVETVGVTIVAPKVKPKRSAFHGNLARKKARR